MDEVKKHSISMENRERLTITDVDEVESFDDEKVIISTSMGLMTVSGSDFKIHKLNVDDVHLVIEGFIDEIKYSENHGKNNSGGFFSRIFQ